MCLKNIECRSIQPDVNFSLKGIHCLCKLLYEREKFSRMTGKSLKAQKNGRLVGSLALPANEEKMSARDWGKLLHVSLQLLLSQDFY